GNLALLLRCLTYDPRDSTTLSFENALHCARWCLRGVDQQGRCPASLAPATDAAQDGRQEVRIAIKTHGIEGLATLWRNRRQGEAQARCVGHVSRGLVVGLRPIVPRESQRIA